MGYTLSLPLKDDTYKEKILDVLEDFSSKTITLHVSTDKKEHGYAVDIYNGIFFSYSILDLNYFQDKDIPYSLIEEKEFKFIENKNLFFKIILKNKIKSFKKEISNINSKVEEL